MADTILQGEKITRVFHQGKAEAKILDGIDIKIYEKDFTVIMGPSGAGKSTLLYSLSGMDQINGGHVLYRGREISSLSEKQMARLRAEEFGFVFQQTHLVSNLTLLENVLAAGYVGKKDSAEKVRERARNLLQQMDVEEAKDRLPAQVSGGEAQRAAIARAMIGRPGLLFADEPTGSVKLVQHYPKEIPVILFSLSMRISDMADRHSVRFSSRVRDS
jgi:ABC-type lipoprotein export system ATPase subunit